MATDEWTQFFKEQEVASAWPDEWDDPVNAAAKLDELARNHPAPVNTFQHPADEWDEPYVAPGRDEWDEPYVAPGRDEWDEPYKEDVAVKPARRIRMSLGRHRSANGNARGVVD